MKDAIYHFSSIYNPDARRWGNKYDKRLEKIAKRLNEAGVSPYSYIQFLFVTFAAKQGGVVYPNQVTSEKMVDKFCKSPDAMSLEIRTIIRMSLYEVTIQMASGRELKDIILDPDLKIHSTVRYALASMHLPELAKEFEDEAKYYFDMFPEYKQILEEYGWHM